MARHARVPRPMGMDFALKPASSVQPLPSSKFAKDTTKGRLAERMLSRSRRRAGNVQAVEMSVEGRTIDRL